ncbi:MAG: GLUG motif-containing protein, partial [Thermoplasmata archaeon]
MGIRKIKIGFVICIIVVSIFSVSITAATPPPPFGGGSGTINDPYLIEDVDDLQAMEGNLSAHYALANDIDASATVSWNGGDGFEPIGTYSWSYPELSFTGSFDGKNYNISGLYIDRSSSEYVGLFGATGSGSKVANLSLDNTCITGDTYVGGLVGFNNQGSVNNSHSAGNVSGDDRIGGLVGQNNGGTVEYSSSTASVSGVYRVGGLVGKNNVDSLISKCSAAGSVTGTQSYQGGLVGRSIGGNTVIEDSYASGEVDGYRYVGGLVGSHYSGSILRAYSTGNVSGYYTTGGAIGWNGGSVSNASSAGDVVCSTDHVGGLIGDNRDAVLSSQATGNVSGRYYVGGLIGYNYDGSSVDTSLAIGDVNGLSCVGGSVGYMGSGSTVTDSYSRGKVNRTSGSSVHIGGFVGRNYRGKVIRCYSTGSVHGPTDRGFAGTVDTWGSYQMTGNFWDVETSGHTGTAGGAVGKTTEEMMNITTFDDANWDMTLVETKYHRDTEYTWNIVDNVTYPALSWEEPPDYPPLEFAVDNEFLVFEEPDIIVEESVGENIEVLVAVHFEGEDHNSPMVSEAEGFFQLFPQSIGEYIDVGLETEDNYTALIMFRDKRAKPYNPYLRMYRESNDEWQVITDWEEDEYTGVNVELGYTWATVDHFSLFTLALANEIDGDDDGLSDLTEGTEPVEPDIMVYTHEDFGRTSLEGTEDTVHLNLSLSEYDIYTTVRGYIELSPMDEPVEGLELDIGGDGSVNWRGSMPLNETVRIGQIWNPINRYLFEHHINTAKDSLEVPFVFSSSNGNAFNISYASIELERVITHNYATDTSGDGLFDGWQDVTGDMVYVREGQDGILGTADDNTPGSLVFGLDPVIENAVGGTGRIEHNVYHEGMSAVNAVCGNLLLEESDLGFNSYSFGIYARRAYNSQSDRTGVLGPGWQLNYEQRLEFDGFDITYVDETGAEHRFENNEDGTYSPGAGNRYSLVANFLPDPPAKPELTLHSALPTSVYVNLTQVEGAQSYEVRFPLQPTIILDHDPSVPTLDLEFTDLEPATEYKISAKSVDPYGQASHWTELTVQTTSYPHFFNSEEELSGEPIPLPEPV